MEHSATSFLAPRRIGILTVPIQIGLVCVLYILTTLYAYWDYTTHGTMFGYPLSISILFVPIYEEILFRGLILGYLHKHCTRSTAIILTSFFFALWHLKNIFFIGPMHVVRQMLYTGLIISPLFSYITLKTKSIWPSVILHYVNNLLSPISQILLRSL